MSGELSMMVEPPSPARELAPGVYWLPGYCIATPVDVDTVLHSYNASYLVSGEESSVLVDPSHPSHFEALAGEIDRLLAGGLPPVHYVFLSHWELPHAGSTARALERYPEAIAFGDLTDFHLMFPGYAERVRHVEVGEAVDLGGTEFGVLPAVVRDAITTVWGFSTSPRALFPADGFGYMHLHAASQCGLTAEEAAADLDLPHMAATFADGALYWTRFVDVEPYIAALDRTLAQLRPSLVCPTHGLPINDLATALPLLEEGIRRGSSHTGLSIRERDLSRQFGTN